MSIKQLIHLPNLYKLQNLLSNPNQRLPYQQHGKKQQGLLDTDYILKRMENGLKLEQLRATIIHLKD